METKNALTDFDLCLALAQRSIDTQMKYAWRAWKRKTSFSDTIDIFPPKKDGTPSSYGLSATFEPLTINLTVPDAKQGQVQVTLRMKSGKVVYYSEEYEEKKEEPIQDWSVSFITDLDKKPVDLVTLKQIDAQAHQTAEELMRGSGLSESVFSIEYLFLKLTSVDLLLADNRNVHIPEGVPRDARTKALSSLNLLLQGKMGNYLLGTVVRRNSKQAAPTFAMTDFVFDVRPHASRADCSTLNYLGQFSGRPLPQDVTAARLKLSNPWLSPEQLDGRSANVSGVMGISCSSFMEKYLIPKVRDTLARVGFGGVFGAGVGHPVGWEGPVPARDGNSWTFSDSAEFGEFAGGPPRIDYLSGKQSYMLKLAIQPSQGAGQLGLSGKIATEAGHEARPFKEADPTEWTRLAGHRDFSGSITLTGSGIGTQFQLDSHLETKWGEVVMDKQESNFVAEIIGALGSLLKAFSINAESPKEFIEKASKEVEESFLTRVQKALSDLDMDLRQHAFIPPGGGVFTFQNARFSQAGDLFFDVIYRAA